MIYEQRGFSGRAMLLVALLLVTTLQSQPAVTLGQPLIVRQASIQETDEEQIRRIVRDSQFNETLGIYENPATFDKALLTTYWLPEAKGGKAIVQVEESIRRLLEKHWRYSKDSANEMFEIRSVKIYPDGVAEVRTRERWYLPVVDEQDHIVTQRDPILDYQVVYRLVKLEGSWLLLSNSTPRPGN